ncbi:hypothetical protein ACROYT_G017132 [Oculina patagonica]
MVITVLTSIQNNVDYSYNRDRLERALQADQVKFLDPYIQTPEIRFFDKQRVYDFTRSAKAQVREQMLTYLKDALLGLSYSVAGNVQMIRGALDCFFNYQQYKESVQQVAGQRFAESMEMLISVVVREDLKYAALVNRIHKAQCASQLEFYWMRLDISISGAFGSRYPSMCDLTPPPNPLN